MFQEKELFRLITAEQAWHYRIIPKSFSDYEIVFFSNNNNSNIQELEILFGKKITLSKCEPDWLQIELSKNYLLNQNSQSKKSNGATEKISDDFLIKLITESKRIGSSDIHIETYDENCRVRIRIDGLLIERHHLKKDEYPSLINKIKIKANLDIAEKRLPQDGRICFTEGQEKFDIRVSVLPTMYGEKVVMRLLSNSTANINLESLGFSERELYDYKEAIKKPHGIILISGPTGSGKTTTLYATLKILNKENTNILTVEDPIEYTLEGVNQVQLKESIGLTFSYALRTFLRQDPDIIMLGEIRDAETAQMAIRAALTGHLVLSTIHTNSAWGSVARLEDMGVPSFLIANTLNATIAQRLVRLLCEHCKEKHLFSENLYPRTYRPLDSVHYHYTAKGCDRCYFTGYKGRRAIYEVIVMDSQLSEKIKTNNHSIDSILSDKKVNTLAQGAFELFSSGLTSIDEIYPILSNTNF